MSCLWVIPCAVDVDARVPHGRPAADCKLALRRFAGLCSACTNGPPNSQYTDHGGGIDECPFVCNAGYAKVGDECKDDTFWVAKTLAGGVLGTGHLDGTGTWALFNRPNGVASGVVTTRLPVSLRFPIAVREHPLDLMCWLHLRRAARGPNGEWFVDVADTANQLIRRINVETGD